MPTNNSGFLYNNSNSSGGGMMSQSSSGSGVGYYDLLTNHVGRSYYNSHAPGGTLNDIDGIYNNNSLLDFGLKHDTGLAVEWSVDEQYKLEQGLAKYANEPIIRVFPASICRYANEPNIMRYIKIAASLQDKTVRDVALRYRWITRKRIKPEDRSDDLESTLENIMSSAPSVHGPAYSLTANHPQSNDYMLSGETIYDDGLKFADRLGHAGVKMLLDFLKGNDHHRNKKIQPLHIHPLFLCKSCLASAYAATGGFLVVISFAHFTYFVISDEGCLLSSRGCLLLSFLWPCDIFKTLTFKFAISIYYNCYNCCTYFFRASASMFTSSSYSIKASERSYRIQQICQYIYRFKFIDELQNLKLETGVMILQELPSLSLLDSLEIVGQLNWMNNGIVWYAKYGYFLFGAPALLQPLDYVLQHRRCRSQDLGVRRNEYLARGNNINIRLRHFGGGVKRRISVRLHSASERVGLRFRIQDFFRKLLKYSPNLRWAALEACAHPFFDELREPNVRLQNGRSLPPPFNLKEEIHLIVSRLCASIEGISPAHSDGCLGLDSFKMLMRDGILQWDYDDETCKYTTRGLNMGVLGDSKRGTLSPNYPCCNGHLVRQIKGNSKIAAEKKEARIRPVVELAAKIVQKIKDRCSYGWIKGISKIAAEKEEARIKPSS
ncbi:hypothetical protein OROHE_000223 [Orobanche hederae]